MENAGIAQLVEPFVANEVVAGSNPYMLGLLRTEGTMPIIYTNDKCPICDSRTEYNLTLRFYRCQNGHSLPRKTFEELTMAKLNRKKTPKDVKENLTEETKTKFRVIIGEKIVQFAQKIARGFTIRDLRG